MPFWKEPSNPTRQDRRRGTPRPIAVPRPNPRDPLGYSGISPIGGASLLVIIICTARRRGVSFAPAKETKTRSRGTDSPLTNPFLSPCCAGYERHFSAKKPSVLHADGLEKCLRRIFIAAALERRTANHHPCPLLRGGELRGGKANNLRSAAHLSASHSPYRLAVPEKIFALFVCSIFSTATDSPPRFIRHRRRSAPNPHPPRPVR